MEDCVNAAGVDVNTASVALLSWVSGLTAAVATSIVDHRDVYGVFKSRSAIRSEPRLGPKRSSNVPGFCVSITATTRAMRRPFTPKRIRWWKKY